MWMKAKALKSSVQIKVGTVVQVLECHKSFFIARHPGTKRFQVFYWTGDAQIDYGNWERISEESDR